MHDPVPITIPQSVMMHDFAITENHAIFLDLPLVVDGKVCLIQLNEFADSVLFFDICLPPLVEEMIYEEEILLHLSGTF